MIRWRSERKSKVSEQSVSPEFGDKPKRCLEFPCDERMDTEQKQEPSRVTADLTMLWIVSTGRLRRCDIGSGAGGTAAARRGASNEHWKR